MSEDIKFVICSSSVNFQSFGKFSDLNLEWSGQGSLHIQTNKQTNKQTETLISELGTI